MAHSCNIILVGASGRMGQEIIASAQRSNLQGATCQVVFGIVADSDPKLGQTIPGIDAPLAASLPKEFSDANVIIDFSSAAGSRVAADIATKHSIPLLCCSTGLTDADEAIISSTSESVAVVRARNTSVGVNVLAKLVSDATSMLGKDYEIELVELHHRHKTDSPSGTAYLLLEEAAAARNVELTDVLDLGRKGDSLKRDREQIGAQAVRGGDVAGEHTVYFFADGERIELTHRATNRKVFADGAIRAAKWLHTGERSAKLYSMQDVLATP